jgi:type 1 glutamine amidotransferase
MNLTVRILALATFAVGGVVAADVDPYDQSKVPLEVDTTDASLTKIVLVAGSKSHGPGDHEFFAGCAILMDMLKQTPGVFPVMARDGWPRNEAIFKGAKSVLFYMDGRGGHPVAKHFDVLQPLIDQGVGWVNLHYAVDYTPKDGAKVIEWMGGFYDAEISINPHWDADFSALPDHPVSRGVKPFKIRDEWYYNMRWLPDQSKVVPLLQAVPPDNTRGTPDAKSHPGRSEVTAWAYERANGGRAFGFTGGHTHRNWANDDFRRLVVNAILWTAKVEVPKEGAPCVLAPGAIERNLDDKGKKK